MRSLGVAMLLAGSIVPASAQQTQDTLRIRLNADIRSLDPGTNRDGNTDVVQEHLYEGLVAFKEDASVGPMLAKSIEVSPDGKTYTFVLRDGVTFSNGEPLTSDDVLFAWKRYTDPATGWRCLPEVDGRGAVKVTSVVAGDAQTVTFALEKPSALFLATLARPDCGQTGIYHKSSLGPDGKFATPVTTAPFRLGEWRRGQYIELLRNERYSALPDIRDGLTGNKTVGVPKARFVIIPDEATTKAAVQSRRHRHQSRRPEQRRGRVQEEQGHRRCIGSGDGHQRLPDPDQGPAAVRCPHSPRLPALARHGATRRAGDGGDRETQQFADPTGERVSQGTRNRSW